MQDRTPEEYKSFLLDEARTAKLATVRKDGWPHVVPVWFGLDGDIFVFTTWYESIKASNVRWDPRLSMCIDEQTPPVRLHARRGRS